MGVASNSCRGPDNVYHTVIVSLIVFIHACIPTWALQKQWIKECAIQAGIVRTLGTTSLEGRQVMIRQSTTRCLFTKHSDCGETDIPMCSCNSSTRTQADAQKADYQKSNKCHRVCCSSQPSTQDTIAETVLISCSPTGSMFN